MAKTTTNVSSFQINVLTEAQYIEAMSDGFGESVDHNQIPGAPDGYMLYL